MYPLIYEYVHIHNCGCFGFWNCVANFPQQRTGAGVPVIFPVAHIHAWVRVHIFLSVYILARGGVGKMFVIIVVLLWRWLYRFGMMSGTFENCLNWSSYDDITQYLCVNLDRWNCSEAVKIVLDRSHKWIVFLCWIDS